ncbi:FtsK/SpoIIIE family DNA translocase [Hoeflea poritis]|uniref:DNA translocase FtsK n=1 Tax=Hoeflea poritis TaxID=2993659 RepID=A0ABT4VL81_9HYPH|nr:DNA translocase FtsK [Hoeflea poritis]MDA4845478.1 DNA translocase FtsK [Hoeflea poritis]
MQSSGPLAFGGQFLPSVSVPGFLRRPLKLLFGLAVLAGLCLAVAALATWNVQDPSFSYATGKQPVNVLGFGGAAFADILMQFFGLSGIVALLPMVAWGLFLIRNRPVDRVFSRLCAWFGGAVLFASVFSCVPAPDQWPLPTGLGGVFGDMILRMPAVLTGDYPSGILAAVLGLALAIPATWLMLFGALLIATPQFDAPVKARKTRVRSAVEADEDEEDDEDSERSFGGALILGAITHMALTLRAHYRRLAGKGVEHWSSQPHQPYDFNEDEFAGLNGERVEPQFESGGTAAGAERHDLDVDVPPFDIGEDIAAGDEGPSDDWAPQPAPARSTDAAAAQQRVVPQAKRPVPGNRVQREAQTSMIKNSGFELPPLHLLSDAKNVAKDASLSPEALEQNARMLEGVLEDFGVRGEIIQVRPGPVVTLYELEPAPGIKSSRVIGLADDIARSMSAIAARVAVVPGRNAIGIELPNQGRETVYLKELLSSRDFESSKAKLALSLGKTIGGESVIADLAKMPHLLVAGTTGSGKSVAINTMILSIVYRLPPEKCRLIMIDPKMLELSVYDGIPHLLTPVVTDPKKAVVALKWTVREMEDRYKKMSKIGVRNIDGFNNRVEQARKKGEAITRTVQTGFDRETGEAVYETEEFDLSPMPYIIVIIDEMADLMMVAGKDIEGAVQRLAQMARAAGIHVIMATQRPSVDVITGTIKANFPTRISFQVTSKIDSRTILGEQGAEQLLGMGDMLYMAGGGRIQRVHGPFVADNEVEEIVAFLKAQGVPEYLDAITEDDEEDGAEGGGGGSGNLSDSADPYDQAVAVVLRDGKASTSYIQRRLGIGYNRAASLIERMEEEGVIGPANHAGKREILVPTEEDVL